METLLDAIGAVSLILLILIGLGAGYLAGKIAGRHKPLYLVVGVVAAIATPFVLAALGIGVLAAGGLILLALVSAAGALVVLALVRVLLGRG
ncbi:GlsB/YeaQ/YmgE family stress response membrane protein [Roseovarius sp. D0-M9]|uniref:GlsB/YeaQ/YmgE family stress response membrane protein n=1 Tax=Roseovarius sp. D0-M9 TaxID=3127117 RepID=UPI0030103A4D